LAEYQVLRRAPISEALIDIRVKLSSKLDVRQIDSIYESIKPDYPQKLEQGISRVQVEQKPGEGMVKSSTKIRKRGIRVRSQHSTS